LKADLSKQFQLTVVVVGFFTTLLVLAMHEIVRPAPTVRVVVTLVVALSCAIRYWWVILLLDWPPTWFRTLLLLLAWSALPGVALAVGNVTGWALSLSALSTVGFATEVYNGATKQWEVGSDEMRRSLRSDHTIGAAATAGSAVLLVALVVFLPAWLDRIIPVLVALDCVRLIMMINRHQRLIEAGRLQ